MLLFTRGARVEGRLKGLGDAAAVLEGALHRIATAAQSLSGVDFVVSAPGGAPQLGQARTLRQSGATFGERLGRAVDEVRSLGYARILVVADDVPELDAAVLARAFRALEHSPVVLGPSPDGGIYLIGLRAGHEALFANVRWQTRSVFAQLCRNEPRAAVLDSLLDLDARSGLAELRARTTLPGELARLLHALLATRRPESTRAWKLPFSAPTVWALLARGPPSLAART